MKKLVFYCLTALMLIVISICLALYLWTNGNNYYVNTADNTNADEVVMAFVFAMEENKNIKPFVAVEKWPEIDAWMENHQVFECPFSISPIIPNAPTSYGGGSPIGLDSYSYDYTSIVHCPSLESSNIFEIRGIILEKSNGQWQIIDWEEICEIRPGENDCHKLLN